MTKNTLEALPVYRGSAQSRFLAKHAKRSAKTGMWTVHTPMRAYKQTKTKAGHAAVVVLEIPVGALVFARSRANMIEVESWGMADASDRKMRVSEAKVVEQRSLAGIDSGWFARDNPGDYRKGKLVKTTYSDHSPEFKYTTGEVVKPRQPFSMEMEQCESGIHIFLSAVDAVSYDFT